MPRPPIDRYSLEAQLARRRQDLALAQAERGQLSLRQASGHDVEAELQALEAELAEHQRAIERLLAAQQAARVVESAEQAEERAAQVAEHRARVERLSVELETSLQAVTQAIESVAGPLAQALAASGERAQAAAAAVRQAGGAEALQRATARSGLPSGTESVAAALIGALVRSGIGSVPGLSPFVVIDAPLATPAWLDVQHLLARDAARLVGAIDSAAAPAKARATNTQEPAHAPA